MYQHDSNYFTHRPLTLLAFGSKGKIQHFQNMFMLHIIYQIKLNHECSNMVAHILQTDEEIKLNLFQNMVMLHIKLKEMTYAAVW